MNRFVCSLLQVYLIVLFARAILSWFPMSGSGFMTTVQRVLFDVTEPVLAPMRRIIPPAGNFDLSFMIVSFIGIMLQRAICG